MCRVGPALLRNHIALLAVALRLIMLWLGITMSFCNRVAEDVYWRVVKMVSFRQA